MHSNFSYGPLFCCCSCVVIPIITHTKRCWFSVFSESWNFLCIPLLGVSFMHEPKLILNSCVCFLARPPFCMLCCIPKSKGCRAAEAHHWRTVPVSVRCVSFAVSSHCNSLAQRNYRQFSVLGGASATPSCFSLASVIPVSFRVTTTITVHGFSDWSTRT